MLTLTITTGGAAFGDGLLPAELGRILTAAAAQITRDVWPDGGRHASGPLRDVNGNTVGRWAYAPECESCGDGLVGDEPVPGWCHKCTPKMARAALKMLDDEREGDA